jgi:hypothetical protein
MSNGCSLPHPGKSKAERSDAAIRDGLLVRVSRLLRSTPALAAPGLKMSVLIDEAKAIGTTYLGDATHPETTRSQTQPWLRQYVDARLDFDNARLNLHRGGGRRGQFEVHQRAAMHGSD